MKLSDGTVEGLKWLALLLMTADHINKYLFNATLPIAFELGRLCLPLFVIILAFNLARPGAMEQGAHLRTIKRLAMFGTIASVPFISLGGLAAGWWPLNVLFTLLVTAATIHLIELGGTSRLLLAALVFTVGGAFVEYWWAAVALGVASWFYCKHPSWGAAVFVLASCASLSIINRNWWALGALPIILAASRVDLRMPRLRWAFYAYYPLHLTVLWIIRARMKQAGYLFF